MICKFIESAGGRRFLLALIANIITAILVLAGKIDNTTYATVIIATVGAYIAGNTVEKLKSSDKNEQ